MIRKLGISIFLILAGLIVFVLGSPYYTIFPTNWNLNYYLGLTVFFLLMALVLKRSRLNAIFWPAAYAFFIASAALLFLKIGVLNLHLTLANPVEIVAIDKLSQFLHVVPVIVVLTLLAKEDMKSIFIQTGNLKRGLVFGLLSFTGFAVLGTLLQAETITAYSSIKTAIPWMLVFVFANSIMEELWFRAIFLRKFERLIGRSAAIVVTAIVFGASHINATYEFPGGGAVFGLVVFGLGLVGAYSMLKDDSLIGPVLFHAGYDLVIIVSILNSLPGF